jgi:hypothetical protein
MALEPNAQLHLDRLNEAVAAEYPYPENRFAGRGIVIGAGGAKFFTCAWAAVAVLRHLGCTLPIEFWVLGRHELDPLMEAAAESIGVRIVDASEVCAKLEKPPRILNGWELKPFSVIHSAFEEVLYLDADCICASDPSFLFECGPYLSWGAVFWPDLPPNTRSEWIPHDVWERVGLVPRNEVDFESGQFLIHKARCWKELQVTMHLNEYSDYWYTHVYGDKSTYHLAWQKLGTRYAIPSTPAGWTWPAILQHDFEGKVLFQHCCQGKEAICEGRDIGALAYGSVVAQAIAELKQRWNGKIWDFQGDHGLAGDYLYWRHSLGARFMKLEADGRITTGQAKCEKRWSVYVIGGQLHLVVIGEAHKDQEIAMMICTRNEAGVWCGRWACHERCLVNFIPAKLLQEGVQIGTAIE